VDETLAQVGLTDVARRRVGKFSLGMRQRLQLATALLGDPEILILDEPSNGLDPQGIQWLRTFIRHQASLGHAVLVSSHLLSEMEETVDDVVIVSHGQLVLQTTLADLASRAGTSTGLRIRSPELGRLVALLQSIPVGYRPVSPDTLVIDGATPEWFGPWAAQHQIVLYELTYERGSLEDVFLTLTHGFDATQPGAGSAAGAGVFTGPGSPGAAGVFAQSPRPGSPL
jgi:ABC-2 type transport system ATP-binding protein